MGECGRVRVWCGGDVVVGDLRAGECVWTLMGPVDRNLGPQNQTLEGPVNRFLTLVSHKKGAGDWTREGQVPLRRKDS